MRTRVTRPPNAFLLFNKQMRKKLKGDNPSWTVGDISKEISALWKALGDEERQSYVAQANKIKSKQQAHHPNATYIRRSRAELIKAGHYDKQQQKRRAAAGIAIDGTENQQIDPQQHQQHQHIFAVQEPVAAASAAKRPKRLQKRQRTPGAPKHPLSAFMWFLSESRAKTRLAHPGSTVGQLSKLIAAQWKTMTDVERLPWINKAANDKDRYAKEMRVYAAQPQHPVGKGTRQKYGATMAYYYEQASNSPIAASNSSSTSPCATPSTPACAVMPGTTPTDMMATAAMLPSPVNAAVAAATHAAAAASNSSATSPTTMIIPSPLFYSPAPTPTATDDFVSSSSSPCHSPTHRQLTFDGNTMLSNIPLQDTVINLLQPTTLPSSTLDDAESHVFNTQ
ncbi:high mobility group box domain-containing protein [Gongronella butleri]|nr:high mobility group box domain-containing protein [Gongronella butleri]